MKLILIFLFVFLSLKSFSGNKAITPNDYNNSAFGYWERDQNNLPCFILNFREQLLPWYPFSHIMGTGNITVLTNQWGAVNFYENQNGISNVTPSYWHTKGGFYPMIKIGDETISLIITELDTNKVITYGVGYTRYSGTINRGAEAHFKVVYEVITPFNYSNGFYSRIQIENLSPQLLKGKLMVHSETWMKPDYARFADWEKKITGSKKILTKGISCFVDIDSSLSNLFLLGDTTWNGTEANHALQLNKEVKLNSGQKEDGTFYFGFGVNVNKSSASFLASKTNYPNSLYKSWKDILVPVQFNLAKTWMEDECLWTYSQLLSFGIYDNALDERYPNFGGYGMTRDPAEPFNGFCIREIAGEAIVLSHFNPSLAKSSLRWLAKTQLKSGDLIMASERNIKKLPKSQILQSDFPAESDTEIWFLLALGEFIKTTKDTSFLNEIVPYLNECESGTIWEHYKATYYFIKNYIGIGDNGLIRMLHDWNEYLNRVGYKGKGTSVMNTGMVCRALINLKETAVSRNEMEFANEVGQFLSQLQKAMSTTFDNGWFIRAYDDDNNLVGNYSDRLFIDAQAWAALGKCGTSDQRKAALQNAVRKCSTAIGMTLMSKPYSCPAPPNISVAPITAGEGENAGIWPQAVCWMVWALAEEGLTELAKEEWEKITLRNHTRLYPNVPLGVINGPDCYSSKFAGQKEGWTQTEMFNRLLPVPMSPMIAWQAFAMKKILESTKSGTEFP